MSARFTITDSNRRGYGLVLLLMLAVLVPSACLLWFMNQAVKNERFAVRQKLLVAYRSQLALLQEHLSDYARAIGGQLDSLASELAAPALFAREIRADRAESLVCFDSAGNLVY